MYCHVCKCVCVCVLSLCVCVQCASWSLDLCLCSLHDSATLSICALAEFDVHASTHCTRLSLSLSLYVCVSLICVHYARLTGPVRGEGDGQWAGA